MPVPISQIHIVCLQFQTALKVFMEKALSAATDATCGAIDRRSPSCCS
jgi:hypothetical protein